MGPTYPCQTDGSACKNTFGFGFFQVGNFQLQINKCLFMIQKLRVCDPTCNTLIIIFLLNTIFLLKNKKNYYNITVTVVMVKPCTRITQRNLQTNFQKPTLLIKNVLTTWNHKLALYKIQHS